MNSDTICSKQIDLHDNSIRIPLTRIFSPMVGLYTCWQNAYRTERQAKRLYAMSNAELNEMGIAREDISSYLASLF